MRWRTNTGRQARRALGAWSWELQTSSTRPCLRPCSSVASWDLWTHTRMKHKRDTCRCHPSEDTRYIWDCPSSSDVPLCHPPGRFNVPLWSRAFGCLDTNVTPRTTTQGKMGSSLSVSPRILHSKPCLHLGDTPIAVYIVRIQAAFNNQKRHTGTLLCTCDIYNPLKVCQFSPPP